MSNAGSVFFRAPTCVRKSAQVKVARPFFQVMKVFSARYADRSEPDRPLRYVVAAGWRYVSRR